MSVCPHQTDVAYWQLVAEEAARNSQSLQSISTRTGWREAQTGIVKSRWPQSLYDPAAICFFILGAKVRFLRAFGPPDGGFGPSERKSWVFARFSAHRQPLPRRPWTPACSTSERHFGAPSVPLATRRSSPHAGTPPSSGANAASWQSASRGLMPPSASSAKMLAHKLLRTMQPQLVPFVVVITGQRRSCKSLVRGVRANHRPRLKITTH